MRGNYFFFRVARNNFQRAGITIISVISTAQTRIPSVEPTSRVMSISVGTGVAVGAALFLCAVPPEPNAMLKKASKRPVMRKMTVRD